MPHIESDDRTLDLIRRFERMEGVRATWESHWEEIAKRLLPAYVGSFTNKDANSQIQGERNTEEVVDATAALALPKFVAANESMLTPRGQTWHKLVSPDRDLMRNRQVRDWYDRALRILFRNRYAPNANFASQNSEVFTGLGAFGTGCLFIDKLSPFYGGGIRYRAVHLAEIFFAENHQGLIDTAFRRFELTARQAIQQFGADRLPEGVVMAAEKEEQKEKTFKFLHCVYPRIEEAGYDSGRLDDRGLPFASRYISLTGKATVSEGGYSTFPYAISRYVQAPGEVYGRSPAMLALPDIKVLNEQKKTVLKQGHRVVDPVILAHDDGILDSFSLTPGTINAGGISAEGRKLVDVLPTGNLALAKEMMEAQAHIINDAFLVTLFQILIETPRMTATEALQRAQEKGVLLSPSMGRQQSEYLGPVIDRELDVLSQQGLLPPVPPLLQEAGGLQYEVIYDSPLSRTQRAEEASGLMRLLDWLTAQSQVTGDISAFDWIDMDVATPELAEISAVPTRWIRDPGGVEERRTARAEAQQAQQMLEAAPALAGAVKALPEGAVNALAQ